VARKSFVTWPSALSATCVKVVANVLDGVTIGPQAVVNALVVAPKHATDACQQNKSKKIANWALMEAAFRRMSTEQEPDQKISEESVQDIAEEALLNPAFRRMSFCPMWCGAKELCNMDVCATCDMCRRLSTEQEPDQKMSEESVQDIAEEALLNHTPDSAIKQCSSWAPRGFIKGRPSIASGVWCQVGISSAEGNDWKECVDGVTKPAEPALIYTGLCPSSEKESGDIHV